MSDYTDRLAVVAGSATEYLGSDADATAKLDQACAYMADLLTSVEVNVHDPDQARAAFAGAFSMFSNFVGCSVPEPIAITCLVELATYAHRHALCGG